MPNNLRIAIADDHTIFRKTLSDSLIYEEGLNVVFNAANGNELLFELKRHPIDVIILDLDMPIMSGQDALKLIKEKYPQIKIIVLSMHNDLQLIRNMFIEGTNCFLSKGCDIDDLIDAIHAVWKQGFYFTEDFPRELIYSMLEAKEIQTCPSTAVKFTDRELAILKLVCKGESRSEISKKLNISIRTVENHRYNISKKIGSSSSINILIYALHSGIAKISSDQEIVFN